MACRVWFVWMVGSALTLGIVAETVSRTPGWMVWLWAGMNVAQSWIILRLFAAHQELLATVRERRGGRG